MADISQKRITAIMMAQFRKAIAEPNEFIKFAMTNNPSEWYILLSGISGDEDEFVGGEYLCKVVAPTNFPYEPPHFYFMTPNGVYDINCKVCVSIGEFHKESYPASFGMSGFVNQLVSGLIGWKSLGNGISLLKTTLAQKKAYAAASMTHNIDMHEYGLVLESFDGYKLRWDKTKIPQQIIDKLNL